MIIKSIKIQNFKAIKDLEITDFDRMVMELQNPANHEAKVQLALLAQNWEPGKPLKLNLVPVAKTAVSKENKELFGFIKNKAVKSQPTKSKSSALSEFLDEL